MNQDTNHQEVNATPHSDTKFSFRTGLKAGNMSNVMANVPQDRTSSNHISCLAQMEHNERMGNNSIPAGCEGVANDMGIFRP